jgi:hypothetical protein
MVYVPSKEFYQYYVGTMAWWEQAFIQGLIAMTLRTTSFQERGYENQDGDATYSQG